MIYVHPTATSKPGAVKRIELATRRVAVVRDDKVLLITVDEAFIANQKKPITLCSRQK